MQRHLIDGRYTLGELLGGGGMAQVYLARDQVLGRDVALKMLRSQYADDESFVERFRREAKNAAALNHPAIVQVYDQGRAEDGTYYIAMEYVPGGTLAERIKREAPMDPTEAAGVASRVAEALAVAHERGIIHRDIKPQNVLLTASGDAKVADLGIARAASSTTMTETNLIFGTASYMSPEQAKGERVRPQSDLYSLGVVLFQMLTGELPYSADNPLATAMKHVDEPPRHPRDVNPAVPEELDAITAKLLAKAPEDRYASAAILADDLRRVRGRLTPLAADLGQQTTEKMPPETGQTRTAPTVVAPGRTPSPPRRSRRRLLPLGVLLLALLLLGGLAWALNQDRGTPGADAAQRVEVPDVVGLSLDDAQRRLGEAGLRLGSQTQAASSETAGSVIHQDPSSGSQAERGTAVDVTVSTGPAPAPTTQSSSATSSASSSATATPTPSASSSAPAEPQEQAGEQQKQAQEAAAKEQEKAQKEAQKEVGKGPPPKGEENPPQKGLPGGKGKKK